jgi:hypothetical protein
MSGCNKPWSVYVVDATGPVSKDTGEQSGRATPRCRGALPSPERGRKRSKEDVAKDPKDALGGGSGKGTRNRIRESAGLSVTLTENNDHAQDRGGN